MTQFTVDLATRVATVFYYRDSAAAAWQRTTGADPAWACDSVAEAQERMAAGHATVVRAEDAAAVDAWLAACGEVVTGQVAQAQQEVTA